ncbi:hypothetical protein [Leptospira weilii]|nr:hypothetical protein [Leptospira weilii]
MNKFVFQSFEAGLSEQENSMKKEGKIRRETLPVIGHFTDKTRSCSIPDLALRKGAYESFFKFGV